MTPFNGRPIEILLVEDNPGDVLLTQEAFRTSKISNNIHVAKDGEVALNILHRRDDYKDTDIPAPDIILLDLNIPKKDGQEVLREIKTNDRLRRIPVVILTSSKAEQDIVKSYNLHANSYIIKPVDLEKLSNVVEVVEHFWFSIVTLPPHDAEEGAS